jgi:signal transduction histidine kinase
VGGPDRLDTIEGRATGARAGQQIVLYAKAGGLWWVQPFTVRPFTNIQADSRWKGSTHFGTDYAALLVDPGYVPPDTAEALPSLGAGVVAVAITQGAVPVWETSWFRLSIVVLFGFLTLAVFRLRHLRQVRQMNMRFEERLAERTRIARDLHDTLLQSFQGLMLRLQLVEDLLPDGKAKTQLEQTLQRGDQAIREGRRALYDLRSSIAAPTDLSKAVRSLGDEFSRENSAAFHLVVEGAACDLKPVIRDELYLIVREALQNAFSHARAHRIEAEIIYGEGTFRLRIRDDGEGIPTQIMEEGRPGHYGLSGMRERANQIGGKLELWSKAGAGTEIQLSIPGSAAYRASLARSLSSLLRKKQGEP